MAATPITSLLIEAESFDDFGGWTLDAQFMIEMGSPYLLAHGIGRPVADATTTVTIPESGSYALWARAKDWVPSHHPGRFQILLDGEAIEHEFGADGSDWSWEYGGRVDLDAGELDIALRDLTGFDGRCDAIYLTTGDDEPMNGSGPGALAWRRRLRGLPREPEPEGPYDLVVVGGGVTGSIGALVAARQGLHVALVQNRPVLGGNASVEIGIGPRGEKGPLIAEAIARSPEGRLQVGQLLEAEPNVAIYLHHQVYGLALDGDAIASIDARHAITGREICIAASQFIDCTGTAILGILAGIPTLFGIESADRYGESLAPPERLDHNHGHTPLFRTRMADGPVEFPDVPWAVEVAKDYADLGGQAIEPGRDNGDGPVIESFRPEKGSFERLTRILSHYWEYGQWLDPYTDGEHIRDHLLRAVYGTMSNIKNVEPEEWANLEFEWVSHVAAQGEFRRYVGDHILTENDIRDHVEFADAVAQNSSAFCLHHPGHPDYDFRLLSWTWDERDGEPFAVPFRSLYSAHLDNLLMAGKHISATHVAACVTKFMANGAQHAIAAATGASLCARYGITPRQVFEGHLDELISLVAEAHGLSPDEAARPS